jgi:metallophosphoesterase superfamily enzyme
MLRDRNGAVLRVACFSVADRLTILPAFGSFTGAKELPHRPGERLFAVSEHSLIKVG